MTAANTWPYAYVEVAWGYDHLSPAPVFTPLPIEDILAVSYSEGGRSRPTDDLGPATASITLANDDRRYDPDNLAGPHAGQLLPRTPVRLTLVPREAAYSEVYLEEYEGGDAFEQFTLFVDSGWQQDYDPPASGTCTVQLVSRDTCLQGVTVDTSPFAETAKTHNLIALWALDDTGTVMVDSSDTGARRDGVYQQAPETGAAALIKSSKGAVHFPEGSPASGVYERSFGFVPSAGPLTVMVFFRIDRPAETGVRKQLVHASTREGDRYLTIHVEDAKLRAFNNPGNGDTGFSSDAYVSDGRVHSAAFVIGVPDAPSTYAMLIDGRRDIGATSFVTHPMDPAPFALLRYWAVGNLAVHPTGDYAAGGIVGPVALFNEALSDDDIYELHYAGLDGWDHDSTGTRAGRLAQVIGLDAALTSFDYGETRLGPADLHGDVNEMFKALGRTEQGGFFAAGWDGGKLRLPSRYARYDDPRSATPQATLSDDPADTSAVRFERTGLNVIPNGVNSVVRSVAVNYVGGTEKAENDVNYGVNVSVDTIAPSPFYARSLGQWVVALNRRPVTRISSIELNPGGDPTGWATAMSTRIGDRVTFRYQPLAESTVTERDYFVEGRQLRLEGRRLASVTLSLTPTDDTTWARWDEARWDGAGAVWAY